MNINNKIKLFGLVLGVIFFVVFIAGITYAWYTWTSENISIAGASECFTINNTKGSNITQTVDDIGVILFDESKIISDNKITIKKGMVLTNITASIDDACEISGELAMTLTISNLNSNYTGSGNSTGAFKYAVASYDPTTYTTVSVDALNGQSFTILKNGSISSLDDLELLSESLSTTTKGYLIIFYVDGNLAMNDVQDSTFSGTIEVAASQVAG